MLQLVLDGQTSIRKDIKRVEKKVIKSGYKLDKLLQISFRK